MIDYHMISTINYHMGVVTCERCGQEMEILRGVVLPLEQPRKAGKFIHRTNLFAEVQCPDCKNIIIFRRTV